LIIKINTIEVLIVVKFMKICSRTLAALAAGLMFFVYSPNLRSQEVAIKTNLLYDATLTANAGIEVALAKRWTLDLSGNFNSWSSNDSRTWKHWLAQPELRYWFCGKMGGHFLAINAMVIQYNIGGFHNHVHFLGTDFSDLTNNRHQGWGWGGGLAYGYSWILSKHWNLEAELGVGYVRARYDVYNCRGCKRKLREKENHNYYGPTKAAVNISYIF
jgi:hypothetical protein